MRAKKVGTEVVLKGTKVDGVFDRDPKADAAGAVFLPKLSYDECSRQSLKILDSTAVTMARDQHIRITVFNILKAGNLRRVLVDGDIGSEIS